MTSFNLDCLFISVTDKFQILNQHIHSEHSTNLTIFSTYSISWMWWNVVLHHFQQSVSNTRPVCQCLCFEQCICMHMLAIHTNLEPHMCFVILLQRKGACDIYFIVMRIIPSVQCHIPYHLPQSHYTDTEIDQSHL